MASNGRTLDDTHFIELSQFCSKMSVWSVYLVINTWPLVKGNPGSIKSSNIHTNQNTEHTKHSDMSLSKETIRKLPILPGIA